MKRKLMLMIPALLVAGSAMAQVVINEIYYNAPSSQGSDDNYEFLELYNAGAAAVDLTGWSFSAGITYTFGSVSLDPDSYLVLAKDAASVEAWYGITGVLQWDSGNLSNGGELVSLVDAGSTVMDEVHYDDGGDWPGEPDGDGPSLELINPSYDNSLAASWAASTVDYGTPGAQNSVYSSGPIDYPPEIGEVSNTPENPTSSEDVMIQAFVTDDHAVTAVSVVYELDNSGNWLSQEMTYEGGDLYATLIGPFPNLTLVNYHILATDDADQNSTSGNYSFLVSDPLDVLPVVINEIMQNPGNGVSDSDGEWIEIYNPWDVDVDLEGVVLRDNDYDAHVIQSANGNTVVPAGGCLVMGINPDTDVNGGVVLDYVYNSFYLSNGSDEVVLDAGGVILDEVDYDNGATFPDPSGSSMALLSPDLDNNVGANWFESFTPYGDNSNNGTPGACNTTVTDLDLPAAFALQNAYPNPFNPTTTISFQAALPAEVNLSVYNAAGSLVATLVNGAVEAGSHSVEFDAGNLASGVYFVTLQANGFQATQKLLLLK